MIAQNRHSGSVMLLIAPVALLVAGLSTATFA
jgi:hypothetical protein